MSGRPRARRPVLARGDAALPIQGGRDLDDVFAGLEWRRLRLRQDQQVQEWAGATGI